MLSFYLEDIEVHFVEANGDEVWSQKGVAVQVHRQYAIKVEAPKYRNEGIDKDVSGKSYVSVNHHL